MQALLCCLFNNYTNIFSLHKHIAPHKVSSVTAMLCSQALLVQSAMMAMTQQASPASDSEAHSSGRATGEQADGSELRAEYEARLAAAAEQAEQVGSTLLARIAALVTKTVFWLDAMDWKT